MTDIDTACSSSSALMCARIGWWQRFLDSLDTGGGHMFVLLLLMTGGAVLFHYDGTAGGEIINLSFGALLMKIKDTQSNQQRATQANASTASTTVTATTDAPPPLAAK